MSDEKLNELHAMAAELRANTEDRDIRARISQAISGGYDFGDTLHNIYLDYGYPESLDFFNFWNMYRRFGIAKNAVELPVFTGWSTPPTIEGSGQFNNELERLNERVNIWQRLKGLDTRQRVGRYAGMFMRVRDGQTPDQPLDRMLPGENALVEMMPLYEGQLEVIETDTDAMSDTFGEPIMLEYSESITGSRNENTNDTMNIHASRIVFAAEDSDNGWIYGIPALEAGYNSLMDLRKIIGGGGEGIYKNSAQSTVFNLTDPASASVYKDKLEQFNDQYDDFTRNRHRRAMWTPGMEANTLTSNLVQPQGFFDIALNDVAASVKIPATILIGKQTGRLASTEDGEHFLAGVQARRGDFMTEMTRNVFDWLIKFGILPSSEYEVEWDDLLARSDEEKLANADKMASINEKQFRSAGDIPFNGDDIREAAGMEPGAEENPGGEELDNVEED